MQGQLTGRVQHSGLGDACCSESASAEQLAHNLFRRGHLPSSTSPYALPIPGRETGAPRRGLTFRGHARSKACAFTEPARG